MLMEHSEAVCGRLFTGLCSSVMQQCSSNCKARALAWQEPAQVHGVKETAAYVQE